MDNTFFADDALARLTLLFLKELQKSQQAMLVIQEQKQTCLIAGDWEQLQQAEQAEQQIQAKLQSAIEVRKRILQQAHQHGCPAKTLTKLAEAFGWLSEPEFALLLEQVRDQAEQLRRYSWGMWVMAQRASRFYGQLLDRISQGGVQAPCYQQHKEITSGTGGALLDASI